MQINIYGLQKLTHNILLFDIHQLKGDDDSSPSDFAPSFALTFPSALTFPFALTFAFAFAQTDRSAPYFVLQLHEFV